MLGDRKHQRTIVNLYTGNPEEGTLGRRCIKSLTIPSTLNSRSRSMLHNSMARQMEWLFNVLPYRLLTEIGKKLRHSRGSLTTG